MKKELITSIGEFSLANRDLLIIIADPKSDNLFMSYNGVHAMNTIKGVDGQKMHVVKDVLNHSLFKKTSDTFLGALIDFMHLDSDKASQFLQWIDGALYNIARKLRLNKRKSLQVESSQIKVNQAETPIV